MALCVRIATSKRFLFVRGESRMPKNIPSVTSIGELADTLGVQSWRIARLFELGLIQEPPRVSNRRVIDKAMIPIIVDALRLRGWLPTRSPDCEREVANA
jgi:hypothetical protein